MKIDTWPDIITQTSFKVIRRLTKDDLISGWLGCEYIDRSQEKTPSCCFDRYKSRHSDKVRTGPKTGFDLPLTRISLLVRSALVLALSTTIALAQNKGAGPEIKLQEIERQLGSTKTKTGQLEAEMESISSERSELRRKMIDTAARIQARESQISAGEKRLSRLGDEEIVVGARLKKRKNTLADMLAALQKLEKEPPPVLAVRPDDAVTAIRSAMLLSTVVPQIRAEADSLSRELRQFARLRNDIVEEQRQLALNKDQLSRERTVIARLLEVKSKLANRTAAEIKAARQKAEKLASEAGSLRDLLARLEAERAVAEAAKATQLAKAEAREIEEARLAARAENPAEKVTDQARLTPKPTAREQRLAMASPDRLRPAASFVSVRGELSFPAQGEVFRQFGSADGYGKKSKGMSLKTRREAQVTSPSDGWVVYAGTFRLYGQLLIIDAGDGYHILLAGMDRIQVSAGQFVLSGEPVGAMGTETIQSAAIGRIKDQSSPVLYVEFRKDGKSIDPRPWWQADNTKARG